MDNFFTSLKLLDYLSEKGHDATGTIKANRVENAPLKEATVLKKESRGSYDQLTEQKTGITLVRYNDNNVVTVASTRCGVQPMGKAKRWCRVAKRQVDVQKPACIINYNTYMGGVDQLDQNISTYRIGIRNRKWYWALLAYLLNATMNNAWQLYRLTPKGREDPKDLLSFIRHIVQTYFQKYTPQRQRASRVSVTGKERVEESVRLSNSLHVLETNPTQIRCGLCRKNTRKKWQLGRGDAVLAVEQLTSAFSVHDDRPARNRDHKLEGSPLLTQPPTDRCQSLRKAVTSSPGHREGGSDVLVFCYFPFEVCDESSNFDPGSRAMPCRDG
ncbi:piggyBac transposable element-derived protein 3-like [Homalodisca vitripennis]|uniref:piggyBac transposable element-derived protein 3-like n=1 Tax=Homalodisca vitripennis TaxID=197043 RepID=UPI001EEA588C|nr:piggyBac transposable element-derived protein 3-like [Homalodisca vitripennis]